MSTTIYPYLTQLTTALQNGLDLGGYPVLVYASLESVSLQGTPTVALVMEDTVVREAIYQGRTTQTLRLAQDLTVVTILRDASDQSVTTPLLEVLGTWQANILNLLCRDVLQIGGPLRIIDLPKPEAIAGGAIAGRIRLGVQFSFEVE
jgi:hypothetical protein